MFLRRLIFLLIVILPCSLLAQQNGADRVETFLYNLIEQARKEIPPIAEPAQVNFSRYVDDWAKEVGLTRKQAEAEIKQWVRTANSQDDFYRKGLANFYQKKFRKAAEFFNKTVKKKSEEVKSHQQEDGTFSEAGQKLIQEGVRDLRLVGHALHLNLEFTPAVQAYQQAIQYVSKEKDPELWAATALDVAQSYLELGARTQKSPEEKLLNNALEVIRQILDVVTREQQPGKWAETQNSLGETLLYLALRTKGEEGDKRLAKGQTAFQNALQVVQRGEQPYYWARVQNNLGLVLSEKGFRKTGEESNRLILDSITAYRSALEVRTYESAPAEWAQTQNNLATTYYFLKDWPKVAECNSNVLKVFPENKAAYQDASELYQKVLFDFKKAFKLNKQWVEKHPKDLFEKIKLLEKYFTTGRFTECQEQINPFKQSQDYSALVYSVVDIIDVSNQLALNKPGNVPAILDGLITRLKIQPDTFKIGLNLAGIKHFVSQKEDFASYRAWLGQFYAAVEQENRDAILKELAAAKASFSAVSN